MVPTAGGAESIMLSECAESMIVSVPPAASMILSAPFECVIMLSVYHHANSSAAGEGQQKQNQRYWRSPINDFGQQRLNGAADLSAAEDGRVLPHFQQIVSGASTPLCPIAAVF